MNQNLCSLRYLLLSSGRSHFARFISSFVLLLAWIGSSSFGFLALAKEAAGPDSPGELTCLELFAQSAAGTETNQVLRLRGADARQQLLVTASFSTGALRDYTREVSYETPPAVRNTWSRMDVI
jgi:hypothetical protein